MMHGQKNIKLVSVLLEITCRNKKQNCMSVLVSKYQKVEAFDKL